MSTQQDNDTHNEYINSVLTSDKGLSWLGQRLTTLEKENRISARQFALSVNFNPSNYGEVKKGTRNLPREKALAIARQYDTSIDWLLNEEAARRPPVEGVQVPFEDFMEVPDLSTPEAVAGFVAAGGSEAYVERLPKLLLPREYEKGNYLVIKVTQSSMDDGTDEAIKEGDKVLCKQLFWSKKEKPLHKRDVVYVIHHRDGSLVFKEIVDHNVNSGIIVCHSWNPDYQDYPIFLDGVIALYEVKKLVERPIRSRRRSTITRSVALLMTLLSLASCGKKEYNCSCRDTSSGQVVDQLTIEARDYDEADEICDAKSNSRFDCELY